MDIERGDQVYYRGEVWEVVRVRDTALYDRLLDIRRWKEDGNLEFVQVLETRTHKVEQVR